MKISISTKSTEITITIDSDSILFELNGDRLLLAQGTLSRPTAGEKIDRAKRGRMIYSRTRFIGDGSKRIYSDRGRSKAETLSYLKEYAKKLYPDAKFKTVKQ